MNKNVSTNGELLSLADISRHFNLPESTARYYCKRFASFLPIHGEGRRRRYGQETLEIISNVLEHMKTGKNASAVEAELSKKYARTTDVYVPAIQQSQNLDPIASMSFDANMALRLMEQQNNAMQSIAQSLSILASQQENMQDLSAAAKEATEENIRLRNEVATLKEVIRSSESVHQDDLDQVRNWMSRLARSHNEKTALDTQAPQRLKN